LDENVRIGAGGDLLLNVLIEKESMIEQFRFENRDSVNRYFNSRIRLIRETPTERRDELEGSPLRVFWSRNIYMNMKVGSKINSKVFNSLSSLYIHEHQDPHEWREPLEQPSKTLKHLGIILKRD